MDPRDTATTAGRIERRAAQRHAGSIRDLRHAAAFQDSQWPEPAVVGGEWLFAGASHDHDAHRADALAGRGMSVVGWQSGDCDGCVRSLAERATGR